jgi:hypothetical protein
MINRYAKDPNHTWFFVKNGEGVWSFQNELGEINCGFFVFYEMRWMIEPQSKMIIDKLAYSAAETLNKYNPLHRKKATIYFRVKTGQQNYCYADLNQKLYCPNK